MWLPNDGNGTGVEIITAARRVGDEHTNSLSPGKSRLCRSRRSIDPKDHRERYCETQ